MTSSIMNNMFIFAILTFSTSSIALSCITPKWDVIVRNTMSDNIVALIKSKDDNLGNRTIPFNGVYKWSFCERIAGSTLFYGYFWWGSRFQSLALFDQNLAENFCYIDNLPTNHLRCFWFVKSDGFYVSPYPNPRGGGTFIKHWG